MFNDKKKILFVYFIAFFALLIVSSQFFHQETNPLQTDQCPICQWQKNTIALSILYFLVIAITFILIHSLCFSIEKIPFSSFFYHYHLRAPPKNR